MTNHLEDTMRYKIQAFQEGCAAPSWTSTGIDAADAQDRAHEHAPRYQGGRVVMVAPDGARTILWEDRA